MVSGRVLQVVLEYLYTGRCLFPPDDLNLGIEVWETGSGTSPLVRTALITYVVTMVRKLNFNKNVLTTSRTDLHIAFSVFCLFFCFFACVLQTSTSVHI